MGIVQCCNIVLLLEKIEIRAFILPRNFPAVLIIFTGRVGAGNPPLPAGRVPRGAGRPSLHKRRSSKAAKYSSSHQSIDLAGLPYQIPTILYSDNNYQAWRDYQMTWNASEFGGIESVVIHPKFLWTPDILLYNRCSPFSYIQNTNLLAPQVL